MYKYKVSVIICFFNSDSTLEVIIKNAVNQTLRDKEIILVNDGSYDNSLKIAQKYADKYDFVKIINQKNMGIAASRNNGLEKSEGEYIVYWDSDDSVENTMLEVLYNRAKADNSDIVCSQFYIYFLAKNIKRRSALPFPNYPITGEEAFRNLLLTVFASFCKRNFVVGTLWDKMIRRDLIIKNNIRVNDVILEDIVFMIHAFLKADKVSFVNNYFYTNFQRMGRASSSISVISKINSSLKVVENFLKEEGLFEKYFEYYKKFYLQLYYYISFKQIYIINWHIKDRLIYKAHKEKLISVLNEVQNSKEFQSYYASLKGSRFSELQILPKIMLKIWNFSSGLYVNFSIFIYRSFLKN
ncbi:glycosyltransferase family 2 protein [Borrelia hermsii]|uniref:Glycosyl transferase family 2 protein n=3 Tax=Borrelia hermsii TaxID=140 RepID=A0AAN0X560_BORHE|nr:glycosyltransferase family 2 protein [Borrelia hermsii]AAX17079.1 SS-1,4-galactosyltransferase [Borrelia hermsii DAH]AJW73368.1 glycosyl transferase [Borrelia hermsii CC1]AMR75278.1 putative glycosyl transferase family 2 protein [Borrelia hermsii]ANA43377.1 glycosyl transferase [Borrelia hermsii HS1]UCP01582.1 glycosyltransferase [Borrelia hermsii]